MLRGQEKRPWGFKYIIKIYSKHIKKNKCMGDTVWKINMEHDYEPVSYNIMNILMLQYFELGFMIILC